MTSLTTPIYCLSCHERGMGEYVRRVFSDGSGFHVMLRCTGCQCNARGPSQWVARQEILDRGVSPNDLPAIGPMPTPASQGVLL